MSDKALAEREQTNVEYRVQVAYTVPVEVIVDLKEGRVDRVVVIDEGIELDHEEGSRQECSLHPIPSSVSKRATELAEAGDWPGWEHGF